MAQKILSFVVIAVLVVALLHREENPVVVKERTTDTLFIVKTDTVKVYEPKFVERRVVDTVYITDSVFVPIEQTFYDEKELKLWVSGFQCTLDSFYVYPKTVERVVTREIFTTTESRERVGLYAEGALNSFSDGICPSVGVCITTPKKVLYRANIGLYKGSPAYTIGIGYKLR